MSVFVAKRFITLIITLWLTTVVIFVVLEILPGDPATIILGISAQPDTLAALREEMGLNRPALVRYTDWMAHLVQGDFGKSHTYAVPVAELILERVTISLPLTLFAILLSTSIAIPLGILAASRQNKPADFFVMGFSQLGIAVPNFWFALLLILLFSIVLRWVPAGGFPGWEAGFIPALVSLILPAVALGLPQSAILARVTRSSLLEVLKEDFIRTAHAKGASRRRALWRHALRNALIPVVTIMGLQFSVLLAGAIIIENVFYLPGLGRLIYQAISQRDLTVVKNVVVILAATVVVINFVVDLLYAVIDPRLRGGERD